MTAAVEGDAPYPSIHVLMGRILAELPAIGKNQTNSGFGSSYKFRGIDDVMDALNPILSRHGVFFLPTTLERVVEPRKTSTNKDTTSTSLLIRYTFYGPAGDFVEATVWGEAQDTADKGTSKAMSMAEKYLLFQAFAISCNEVAEADGDRGDGEAYSAPPAQARPQEVPRPAPAPAAAPQEALGAGANAPITVATKNSINRVLKGADPAPYLLGCFPDRSGLEIKSLTEGEGTMFLGYLKYSLEAKAS